MWGQGWQIWVRVVDMEGNAGYGISDEMWEVRVCLEMDVGYYTLYQVWYLIFLNKFRFSARLMTIVNDYWLIPRTCLEMVTRLCI